MTDGSQGVPEPPAHGGRALQAAARWGLDPGRVLDFSANLNPLGPPPSVRAAARRGLAAIGHYPEPCAAGVAAALARVRDLPPAAVAVTNGGVEAMDLLARSYRGRRVLVPAPAFGEYGRALRAAGAQVEQPCVPPGRTPDVPWLLERARGCAAVWLANPNNPTGVLLLPEVLRTLAAELAGHGAELLVDEAFVDFLPEPAAVSLAADAAAGRLVVLGSLTKFFAMPGLRLGYVVAHPDRLQQLNRDRDPWSVGAPAQAAALAALDDAAFAARTRAWLRREQPRLLRALARVPGLRPLPGSVNFLLVDGTATGLAAWQLQERLAPHRVLIRDCRSFGLPPGFFRTAVRSGAENRRLVQALRAALGVAAP